MTEFGNDNFSQFTKRFAIVASKFDMFAGTKKRIVLQIFNLERDKIKEIATTLQEFFGDDNGD